MSITTMPYFKKTSKNKQILRNQIGEKYAQTEITLNELDINILKERIQLLEAENEKLRKENASLRKQIKPLNTLKDNRTVVSASPLVQNVPNFNYKSKGCNCKGNCANKICGCMKKDLQCSESCNCNVNSCKNKKKNKENYSASNQIISNQKESQKNIFFPELLAIKVKQPIESVSSVDEVFYDANEPGFGNVTTNLDAVRKLTFLTDEDTPEKNDIELSALIQEHDELNKQPISQIEKEPENDNGKVRRNRKDTSSSIISEKQKVESPRLKNNSKTKLNPSDTRNVQKDHKESSPSKVEDTKVVKTRTKSATSKDGAANPKKERKGSKSKRTVSVEIENTKEDKEKLLENPKVNSRPRKNKGSARNEGEVKEEVEKKEPKKVEVKSKNDEPESIPLKGTKTSRISSSRENISSLKQPKDWGVRSSISVEKEIVDKGTSKNTRNKNLKSSFKNIVSRATRAISNDEISLENVQSRVKGLRRSFSSESIPHETVKTTTKKDTLQKSKNKAENSIQRKSSGARTLNRSLSSDKLPKKPLNNFISRVSSSFRKSKSVENQEKAHNKVQIQEPIHVVLTPVKESPKSLNDTAVSKEATEKFLTFDPMQPTRQLQRSPLPGTPAKSISEARSSSGRFSLPVCGGYLSSHEIKIASPPPEILEDLCTEEVDLDTFQTKLVNCKKCRRKFFPHRVELHEAVCKNN